MSEPSLGLKNRVAEAVFLDVHVEGIEQDFAVGTVDLFGECDAFGGCVHYEVLEAVDDLEAKDYPTVFGGLDASRTPSIARSVEHTLVFAGKEFARP